jgi:hypothetical protein
VWLKWIDYSITIWVEAEHLYIRFQRKGRSGKLLQEEDDATQTRQVEGNDKLKHQRNGSKWSSSKASSCCGFKHREEVRIKNSEEKRQIMDKLIKKDKKKIDKMMNKLIEKDIPRDKKIEKCDKEMKRKGKS